MDVPVYIGYDFKIEPKEPASEILIAELGVAGFESFVETDNGVLAYIQKKEWFEDILSEVNILLNPNFNITFSYDEIEQVNWNEEWEKNFNPIVVDDSCTVRAPFHEEAKTTYDIIIEPKMSFGTGHHETTHMMIQHLLELDCHSKRVLDMGCGTGVLAILAELRGATSLEAIDIDNWCYENTLENIERNNCQFISAYQGDARLLDGKLFDIVIANINRNILLADIPVYTDSLDVNGILLLSGFYTEDLDLIKAKASEHELNYISHIERNNWVAAKFVHL